MPQVRKLNTNHVVATYDTVEGGGSLGQVLLLKNGMAVWIAYGMVGLYASEADIHSEAEYLAAWDQEWEVNLSPGRHTRAHTRDIYDVGPNTAVVFNGGNYALLIEQNYITFAKVQYDWKPRGLYDLRSKEAHTLG